MKAKQKFYFQITIYVITCCLIFIVNSCGGKSFQISCGIGEASQLGINHLQPFIEAMDKYKIDNGRYPKVGTELIPKYLDKIPVIAIRGMALDDPQVDVLKTDKIESYDASLAEDGSYFSIRFYPKDQRICLVGRNNICEYRSDLKRWGCYPH